MKKILAGILFTLLFLQDARAQTTYIIRFYNKGTNPFTLSSPSGYLSQRSIERRSKYSIAIDSTDLPVTPRYIDSVVLAGDVNVLNVSKWLNAVTIQTTDDDALAAINAFPFVQSVTGIAARRMPVQPRNKLEKDSPGAAREMDITADHFNYGSSFNQVNLNYGEFLHNIGLRGQNMQITMLDAGFNNYKTVKAFDSVRNNGQILGVFDFMVKDSSVNEDHSHGMQCFSTIAANMPGQFVGTAPKASFYLFRSENASTEFPVEEFNWVCAAERADSVGTDVISSSLGYNWFDAPLDGWNHTIEEMDGNTALATIGADLAARKGILVVNSAGNEGNNSWGRILTPADGDSVLAVGAVNAQGWAAGFSSRGPSADGRVKPDVAAQGVNVIVQFPNNTLSTNSGTSFAAPIMAGMATCLWQGFPEFNNIKIIDALKQSGNRFANPNDSTGYGLPDMRKAFMILLKSFVTSTATTSGNCKVTLNWQSKDQAGMRYEIERKNPGQNDYVVVKQINTTAQGFQVRDHQFTDSLVQVQAGMITYRIRQVVDTSSQNFYADYIDTVQVNNTISCIHTAIDPVNPSFTEFILIPNPVKEELRIKFTSNQPIPQLQIRIFNGKGQLMLQRNTTKGSGTVIIPVTLNLPAGKYYVNLYDGTRFLGSREMIKL